MNTVEVDQKPNNNNGRDYDHEKNDLIEELLKTKAKINRLYFDNRKNIKQIQVLKMMKIKNEEVYCRVNKKFNLW